ncbi:MAG: MFS transporter [Vulcanimicrobiaceae bacterium]
MHDVFTGKRGRIAVGLLIGEFATALQALVVATILPRVVLDLHGLPAYPLAFVAFLAASIAVLPFAGPWSDRFGARRVLGTGFALLAIGTSVAALSASMPVFVGARLIEGAGAGLDYAISFAMIARLFPEPLRPRMFALMSTMWVVPSILGPSYGAFVATIFGWRWAFASFVPLIGLAALLMLPALDAGPASGVPSDAYAALRRLFSRATLYARDRTHTAYLAFALLHAGFFGADAYVTLLLVRVDRYSLAAASVAVTLGALGWSGASAAQPALYARLGVARLVRLGAGCGLLGALGLLAVAFGAPAYGAFPAWTLAGAGMGLAYPTISLAAFADVAPNGEGTTASATLLAATIGMALGIGICGASVSLAGMLDGALTIALLWTYACAALFSVALFLLARRLSPREMR